MGNGYFGGKKGQRQSGRGDVGRTEKAMSTGHMTHLGFNWCPRDERPNLRLNDAQREEIRKRYLAGESAKQLAEEFKVGRQTMIKAIGHHFVPRRDG